MKRKLRKRKRHSKRQGFQNSKQFYPMPKRYSFFISFRHGKFRFLFFLFFICWSDLLTFNMSSCQYIRLSSNQIVRPKKFFSFCWSDQLTVRLKMKKRFVFAGLTSCWSDHPPHKAGVGGEFFFL